MTGTHDTVHANAYYKVRRRHNANKEGIQVIGLDIGSEGSESLVTAANPLPVTAATQSLTLRYEEGATYTYIGEASPGTAESASMWRIKRLTNATNTILWADGNSDFDNAWDGRAGLTYA